VGVRGKDKGFLVFFKPDFSGTVFGTNSTLKLPIANCNFVS